MSEKSSLLPAGEPPPAYEDVSQQSTPSKPPLGPRPPLPLDLPLMHSLRSKRVILASASPRRRQLLAQIGLHKLEVIPSTAPENLPKSLSPFEYVIATATQKALNVYAASLNHTEKGDPELVIAADTVVVSAGGQVLEKPRSENDHIAMLKLLRHGGEHKVFTGVAVMAPLSSARDPGYTLESTVEETTVKFARDTTDEMIMAYVRTREGADKAGGYGIQGIGTLLVEGIQGAYDNVVGLPIRATLNLCEKVLNGADDEDGEDDDDDDDNSKNGEEDE